MRPRGDQGRPYGENTPLQSEVLLFGGKDADEGLVEALFSQLACLHGVEHSLVGLVETLGHERNVATRLEHRDRRFRGV